MAGIEGSLINEKEFVDKELCRPKAAGEKCFKLSVRWYTEWRTYVTKALDQPDNGGYFSPKPIDNSPLFRAGHSKDDIKEGVDYVLVPSHVWKMLVKKYNIISQQHEWQITTLGNEETYNKNELLLTFYQDFDPSSRETTRIGSFVKGSYLETKIKQHYKMSENIDAYIVWMLNNYGDKIRLLEKDNTLVGLGLQNGDVVVIERVAGCKAGKRREMVDENRQNSTLRLEIVDLTKQKPIRKSKQVSCLKTFEDFEKEMRREFNINHGSVIYIRKSNIVTKTELPVDWTKTFGEVGLQDGDYVFFERATDRIELKIHDQTGQTTHIDDIVINRFETVETLEQTLRQMLAKDFSIDLCFLTYDKKNKEKVLDNRQETLYHAGLTKGSLVFILRESSDAEVEATKSRSQQKQSLEMDLCIVNENYVCDNILRSFHRSDTVGSLESSIRQAFGLQFQTNITFWVDRRNITFNKTSTLEEIGLHNNDVIHCYWEHTPEKPIRRARRLGISGLQNLGNTCFMNSALQCVLNVDGLTKYFLRNEWKRELNKDNPLGMGGQIATAYADLVHKVWEEGHDDTAPRQLKRAIGSFEPRFSGYQQQYSHELMSFLLDGLHEDLNRVRGKKPRIKRSDSTKKTDCEAAIEALVNNKMRDDSIVVDLFHGLLKSSTKCMGCKESVVKFEPFNHLSLPLPDTRQYKIVDVVFVGNGPVRQIEKMQVAVPIDGYIDDLCEKVQTEKDVDSKMIAAMCHRRGIKVLRGDDLLKDIVGKGEGVLIHVYQIQVPEGCKVVPLYITEESNQKSKKKPRDKSFTGQTYPRLLSVPKNGCSYEQLHERVCREIGIKEFEKLTVSSNIHVQAIDTDETMENANNRRQSGPSGENESNRHSTTSNMQAMDTDETMENVNNSIQSGPSGENVCDKESNGSSITSDIQAMDTDLKEGEASNKQYSVEKGQEKRGCVQEEPFSKHDEHCVRFALYLWKSNTWEKLKNNGKLKRIEDNECIEVSLTREAAKNFFQDIMQDDSRKNTQWTSRSNTEGICLENCLDLFTDIKKYGKKDNWECPSCETIQCAQKKFDVWKLPATLIIHLSRFSDKRGRRTKVTDKVDFPIKGLDLGKYVTEKRSTKQGVSDGESNDGHIYDLIAVSNHTGGLNGGHYTAYCLKSDGQGEQWYMFNDQHVSKAKNSVVAEAAYVLIYQRRGVAHTPVGSSMDEGTWL